MVDTIKAKCQGGIVTSDNFPVKADIVGAGKGPSNGIAVLVKDGTIYIPFDAYKDLESVITQISTALNAIAGGISSVYIATQGGAPGPGASQIQTACQNAKIILDKLKGQLK